MSRVLAFARAVSVSRCTVGRYPLGKASGTARTRRRSTGGKARHRAADLVDGAVEELLFGW